MSEGKGITDTLILELQEGSEAAFGQIFEKYAPQVYHVALKYLRSEDLANDVVQDTFLKLWEKKKSLEPQLPVKPLIVTICKNIILNIIRHEKIKVLKHIQILSKQKEGVDSANETIHLNEATRLYEKAISLLPPRRKDVYLLKKFNGQSNKEVAKSLNISENTVKSHYSKAIKFIQDFVSNHYAEIILSIILMKDFLE